VGIHNSSEYLSSCSFHYLHLLRLDSLAEPIQNHAWFTALPQFPVRSQSRLTELEQDASLEKRGTRGFEHRRWHPNAELFLSLFASEIGVCDEKVLHRQPSRVVLGHDPEKQRGFPRAQLETSCRLLIEPLQFFPR
jgi:hypothetical protein